MGGDGGSIPKRDDLVRTRSKPEQVGRSAELLAKWKHCALTQEPLRQPIVSCELGRLFNKESLIEFLLDRSKFECASNFSYIRGLKDIKELHLTDNPAFISSVSKSGCVDLVSPYICPVTGLEMNGRYRFCYLLGCGCVFADRALKEIKDSVCIQCAKPYTESDIVTMNGTDEEIAELRVRMEERRLAAKSSKVSKKRKAPEDTPTETAAASGSSCSEAMSAVAAPPAANNEKKTHSSRTASDGLARSSGTSSAGKQGSASSTTVGKDKKPKTIQNDPKASEVFKSLFNTHDSAKKQPQAHWVTYNPQYF